MKCIVNDFFEEFVEYMVYDFEVDIKRLMVCFEFCRRNNVFLELFLLNVEKCKF